MRNRRAALTPLVAKYRLRRSGEIGPRREALETAGTGPIVGGGHRLERESSRELCSLPGILRAQ